MNSTLLDLGFIKIQWYSLTMCLAILSGSLILVKGLKKTGFTQAKIDDLLFGLIACGIIGARLYYILFELPYYLEHPLEIIMIWNGGLALYGSLIGGLIYLIIFCRRENIKVLKMTDMMVIGVTLGQIIGRWGNFFNQEAFGPITSRVTLEHLFIPKFIIDGMYINGSYYHPTFLYEGLWNFIGLIILCIISKYYLKRHDGSLTAIYFIWYGLGRFMIEGYRMDSLMLGALRISQLVSVLIIIIGTMLLIYNYKKYKKEGITNEQI